jgi:hypothetical protein
MSVGALLKWLDGVKVMNRVPSEPSVAVTTWFANEAVPLSGPTNTAADMLPPQVRLFVEGLYMRLESVLKTVVVPPLARSVNRSLCVEADEESITVTPPPPPPPPPPVNVPRTVRFWTVRRCEDGLNVKPGLDRRSCVNVPLATSLKQILYPKLSVTSATTTPAGGIAPPVNVPVTLRFVIVAFVAVTVGAVTDVARRPPGTPTFPEFGL